MASEVYGGLAAVGELKAKVGLACAICIGLSCCASGVSTIKSASSDKHTASVQAITSNASCVSNTCTADSMYTVDSKDYILKGSWSNVAPTTFTVLYNPSDPSDATQHAPSVGLGIGFIVGGTVIFIFAMLIYWLTMSYKPIAAVSGADAIYDVGKQIF